MKVTGSATLNADRAKVWDALNDPSVLVRTIPGCQRLEEVAPDRYRMTISAGVASIKGTYQGDVALTDQQHPDSFLLKASGAGAPGTVSADVRVTLQDEGERTRLEYDADAVVGGVVGGVGQRVLSGVAKKTAGEFFQAVDDVLTGKASSVPAPREEGQPAELGAAGQQGIFTAPPRAGGAGMGSPDFVKGTVLGAVIALAGVFVGTLVTRRRNA